MKKFILIGFLIVNASSCKSLLNLDLTFVGEKSALEKQILGQYEELGSDLTAYSSVRGVDVTGSRKIVPGITDEKLEALRALDNQKYNRDDIERLLLNQFVGEGSNGNIIILKESEIGEDEKLLVIEENNDRNVLYQRLLKSNPQIGPTEEESIRAIFSSLNRQSAPAGSQVQEKDGSWHIK